MEFLNPNLGVNILNPDVALELGYRKSTTLSKNLLVTDEHVL